MDPKLSKNFRLSEFTISQTAARKGIPIIVKEKDPVYQNLQRLCAYVLQPLRDQVKKPLIITSGYRPPALNKAIGGSKTSDHIYGRAADFYIPGVSSFWLSQKINELGLPYDQLINEFGRWVHVSIAEIGKERRIEALTATRQTSLFGNKTLYLQGLLEVPA